MSRCESNIWLRRFWEHQIRDENNIARHVDYIHFNPVKRGYLQQAKDWHYSTFHRYVHVGIYANRWAGRWMVPSWNMIDANRVGTITCPPCLPLDKRVFVML